MATLLAFSLYFISYITQGSACKTCDISEWFPWNSCSSTCGGGFRTRVRSLCCPEEVPFDRCLSELCNGIVTYNDTMMMGKCGMECLNGGTFEDGCKCQTGWTGKCCEQKKNIPTTAARTECKTCDLGHWGQWNTCSKQCGGGSRYRNRQVCCPDTEDYFACVNTTCNHTLSYEEVHEEQPCNINCYNGIFNGTCQCSPGWTGPCCQHRSCCQYICDEGFYGNGCTAVCNCLPPEKCDKITGACLKRKNTVTKDCDDGFYGDGCNTTCNCLATEKCDKETGQCFPQGPISSTRLYGLIGGAVGCFALVQILTIVIVLCRRRKRMGAQNSSVQGKFWIEKANSDPLLHCPENDYEEIPFRLNGNMKSGNNCYVEPHSKVKKSTKKNWLWKDSKKMKSSADDQNSKMYQYLSNQHTQNTGYLTLIDATTGITRSNADDWKPTENDYMDPQITGNIKERADLFKPTEIGYLDMCSVKKTENISKCAEQLKPTEIGYVDMGSVKKRENDMKYANHLQPKEDGYTNKDIVEETENKSM